MICRYCHDGEDMDRLRARIKNLEDSLQIARSIIHDHVTHVAQEANGEELNKIDAAIKNEPNPGADQSCQLDG